MLWSSGQGLFGDTSDGQEGIESDDFLRSVRGTAVGMEMFRIWLAERNAKLSE